MIDAKIVLQIVDWDLFNLRLEAPAPKGRGFFDAVCQQSLRQSNYPIIPALAAVNHTGLVCLSVVK
jgi:hypothetical protein